MPGADPAEDQHPPIAKRVEGLRLQLEPLPLGSEVADVLAEPVVAAIGLGPSPSNPVTVETSTDSSEIATRPSRSRSANAA